MMHITTHSLHGITLLPGFLEYSQIPDTRVHLSVVKHLFPHLTTTCSIQHWAAPLAYEMKSRCRCVAPDVVRSTACWTCLGIAKLKAAERVDSSVAMQQCSYEQVPH
jgi:hypothetical protein